MPLLNISKLQKVLFFKSHLHCLFFRVFAFLPTAGLCVSAETSTGRENFVISVRRISFPLKSISFLLDIYFWGCLFPNENFQIQFDSWIDKGLRRPLGAGGTIAQNVTNLGTAIWHISYISFASRHLIFLSNSHDRPLNEISCQHKVQNRFLT